MILAWLRLELRRRLRSLLVLTLLIAIATGTVLTAVAGAAFAWDAVRALPQVEVLGLLATGRHTIDGVGDPAETLYVLPADNQAMQTVDWRSRWLGASRTPGQTPLTGGVGAHEMRVTGSGSSGTTLPAGPRDRRQPARQVRRASAKTATSNTTLRLMVCVWPPGMPTRSAEQS